MKSPLKSIYAQLTLMFGLLLLVNFIILITTLRQVTIKPTANQLGQMINNQIHILQPLIENKDLIQAQRSINKLLGENEILLDPAPSAHAPLTLTFYKVLFQKLQTSNDRTILIEETETNARIWIKDPWMNQYWLGLRFQAFAAKISSWVLTLLLVSLFLSLLATYWFSRYMLKPFKQMTHMAEDIVSGVAIEDIAKVKASSEVNEIAKLVKDSALQIQQLNKEKEMLLAGVSHDLRTPLARMRIQAEFLNDEECKVSLVEDIEEMDHIIGDFVSFVRSGTVEEFTKTDVGVLIEESLHNFQKQDLEVSFNQPKAPILLNLKPLSFKRAINNIIENAFKYGKPPVNIFVLESQNKITIRIRDHGLGVDKNQLKSIFSPFVMANNKNNQYGSGLGLAIVEKLMQQNLATVSADNHPDGGLILSIQFDNTD